MSALNDRRWLEHVRSCNSCPDVFCAVGLELAIAVRESLALDESWPLDETLEEP